MNISSSSPGVVRRIAAGQAKTARCQAPFYRPDGRLWVIDFTFLLLYTIFPSFQRFFFFIYFLYVFLMLCTLFRHICSLWLVMFTERWTGLCFKWLLEITKLFHTHTGRSNPSGPPITFSFIYTYHSHAGNELCEKKQKKNWRRILRTPVLFCRIT